MTSFRKLTPLEIHLITSLLRLIGRTVIDLSSLDVVEMNDGGMGSLKFVYNQPNDRRMAKQVVERTFKDSDGMPISVTINVDQYDDLFELDIWRVDFGRVITYPEFPPHTHE